MCNSADLLLSRQTISIDIQVQQLWCSDHCRRKCGHDLKIQNAVCKRKAQNDCCFYHSLHGHFQIGNYFTAILNPVSMIVSALNVA